MNKLLKLLCLGILSTCCISIAVADDTAAAPKADKMEMKKEKMEKREEMKKERMEKREEMKKERMDKKMEKKKERMEKKEAEKTEKTTN